MTSTIKNFLLVLTSILATLLLAEGASRLLLEPVSRSNFTPIPRSLTMKPPFPGAPYVLRPGSSGKQYFGSNPTGYFDEGATLTYTINSLGFRGRETTLEKPEGTVRIIGVGDSFTFGSGVRNEDTFLSVLEDTLADDTSPEVEVINLGVGGYNTVHELSILYHMGRQLDPDIVLLVYFLNDTNAGGTAQAFRPKQTENELPFWRRHSRLADIIASGIEQGKAADRLVSDYISSYKDDSTGWKRSREALRKARQLAKQEDFELVLVIFPVLWNLTEDYPFREIHNKISSFAQGIDLTVYDLLPAFDGYDGPELWAHPNNQHPSAQGHRIAGTALADFLSKTYPSIIGHRRHPLPSESPQNSP